MASYSNYFDNYNHKFHISIVIVDILLFYQNNLYKNSFYYKKDYYLLNFLNFYLFLMVLI